MASTGGEVGAAPEDAFPAARDDGTQGEDVGDQRASLIRGPRRPAGP